MQLNIEQIYTFVDDFIKENDLKFTFHQRVRMGRMTLSELGVVRFSFK